MNPLLSRLYVPWLYQVIRLSPLDYLRQMPVCTTNHRRLLWQPNETSSQSITQQVSHSSGPHYEAGVKKFKNYISFSGFSFLG